VVSRAEMPALAGAVERLPALSASRDRLARAAAGDGALPELVRIVESDVVLGIAVLRLANRRPRSGTVASLAEAVRIAGPARLRALAERVAVADPLSSDPDDWALERFRLHALAVQTAMDRIAPAAGHEHRDELLTAALLHDIGKLALGELEHSATDGPEARLDAERAHHGTDHAELGGELARHMAFPDRLATAIADHHRATTGSAGLVRLADMLALYAQGRVVDLDCLVRVSAGAGLERTDLGRLMYELPQPAPATRRALQPCPLSTREVEVLECLAEGQLYKQIGARLGLSTSTVRSHLHRIYTRMGVVDRTQAVLLARESGWI
jgi:putative nucleotidyltransferase with HDIG domain